MSTSFPSMFPKRKTFVSLLFGVLVCCMSYATSHVDSHHQPYHKREVKISPPLASEGSKFIVSMRRPVQNQHQNQKHPQSTSTTFRKYGRQCKSFEPRSHPFLPPKTSQNHRFSSQRSRSPSLKQLNRPFSRPSQPANQPVPVVSAGTPK